MKKIVFMGTPDFAVPALEALIRSPEYEVALVICQPDKPQGRKQILTAPPVKEVYAGFDILKALGVRKKGVNIVSCPTCGRTKIDLIGLAARVEEALRGCDKNITVAVMGCAVNGPGEAAHADIGIAGGNGYGLLFAKGKILEKLPEEALFDALMAKIKEM